MVLRHAVLADVEQLSAIENECFPVAEAATRDGLYDRVQCYPECFLVMVEDGRIVGFVNGMRTDEKDLQDVMYEKASMLRTLANGR